MHEPDKTTMTCPTCARTFMAVPGHDFCLASCAEAYFKGAGNSTAARHRARGWLDQVRAARGVYGTEAQAGARMRAGRAPAGIRQAIIRALQLNTPPAMGTARMINLWLHAKR